MFHGYALRVAAIVAGLLSAAVVWSEVTFFNKEPLSLFAKFLNPAKVSYDYFTIEVSVIVIPNSIRSLNQTTYIIEFFLLKIPTQNYFEYFKVNTAELSQNFFEC